MCLPGTIETVRQRVEQEGLPTFDRRKALLGVAGAAVAVTLPARALGSTTPTNRLQDLTHVFRKDFPLFLGAPVATERDVIVTVPANGFYAQRWSFWEHAGTHLDAPAHFVANGRQSPELTLDELVRPLVVIVTVPANGFYAQRWSFWEHAGTHLDAPAHFVAAGRQSPELTLDELVRPLVVIDISARAATDADALVLPSDLAAFERGHGRIPRGAVVAMNSGWASRAGSVDAYRNVGADGVQHFPGFGKAAVEWLIAERDIAAIGVDTLSLDHGRSATFDTHLTLLSADRYGIENLANLGRVPPRGATIFVGVIPWEHGSGGPARVFARW